MSNTEDPEDKALSNKTANRIAQAFAGVIVAGVFVAMTMLIVAGLTWFWNVLF